MVNFRFTNFFRNLISKYHKKRSTRDHLIHLQTEISNALRKKQLVAAIFIDIKKSLQHGLVSQVVS